jgi:tungstate transport system substrate-binding protein
MPCCLSERSTGKSSRSPPFRRATGDDHTPERLHGPTDGLVGLVVYLLRSRSGPLGLHQGRNAMGVLRRSLLNVVVAGLLMVPALVHAQERSITVASTTSTEQSGLFAHLLPAFAKKTGIDVKVVAVGTGQALDIGRRGDADVVFVHDTAAEEKFVAEGFATKRQDVMYNDFVIVGPRSDPAKTAGKDVLEGLRRIVAARAPFISRGDRSGTHAAELRYWKDAGIDLNAAKGEWYKEIGQGMGPALNTASAQNAYVLADRGTWLSFKNRGDLAILVEGDQRLFNQYGVMLVNPAKHSHVKAADGQAFIDWLVSAEGQRSIAEYRIGGEQLFFPNASQERS